MSTDADNSRRRNVGIAAGTAVLLLALVIILWLSGVLTPTPKLNSGPSPVPPAKPTNLEAELKKGLETKPPIDPQLQERWRQAIEASAQLQRQLDEANKNFTARLAEMQKKQEEAAARGDKQLAEALARQRKEHEDTVRWMQEAFERDAKDLRSALERGERPPEQLSMQRPPLTPSQASDETMRTLLTAGAAALCIAQPQLCWVAALVEVGLAVFGTTEQRQALAEMVEAIIAGTPIPDSAFQRFVEHTVKGNQGRAMEPFLQPLIGMLPPEYRPKGQGMIAPILNQIDREEDAVLKALHAAMDQANETKAAPETVLKTLPQTDGQAHFENTTQRDRALALTRRPVYQRFEPALQKVQVRKK